jgi:MFS family permease
VPDGLLDASCGPPDAHRRAIFALPWALVGIANGVVNTDVGTLLLNRTPERCRGAVLTRVNGLVQTASVVALAVGGLAGNTLGARTAFGASGLLMTATAAALVARMWRLRSSPHRSRRDAESSSTLRLPRAGA